MRARFKALRCEPRSLARRVKSLAGKPFCFAREAQSLAGTVRRDADRAESFAAALSGLTNAEKRLARKPRWLVHRAKSLVLANADYQRRDNRLVVEAPGLRPRARRPTAIAKRGKRRPKSLSRASAELARCCRQAYDRHTPASSVETHLSAAQARIVALALALGVVVAAWLLFEFGETTNHSQAAAPYQTPPTSSPSPLVAPQASGGPPPALAAPADLGARPPVSAIYQCKGPNGRAFRDHPCASNESEVHVSPAGPPSTPGYSLAQSKAIADEMEAVRLRGEAQQRSRLSQPDKPAQRSRSSECAAIDQAIAGVDSVLRALHSASQGDYWTAERRALTDRRFSIGC
ncbi:hypothetical protein [Candidatus Accumulibacter sp. ACC003]|uniref:hypothetical protein n=1 Tax=Candidatus Accumulibacter sp. ACC003 TaxID=2823334 RepID=UPI0025C26718|nr:hypothetical protein [Candidatus Accumulibacter sp. ACC003]